VFCGLRIWAAATVRGDRPGRGIGGGCYPPSSVFCEGYCYALLVKRATTKLYKPWLGCLCVLGQGARGFLLLSLVPKALLPSVFLSFIAANPLLLASTTCFHA